MKKQISILMKPTDDCNLRCRYCFHEKSGYGKNQMAPHTFEKLISLASNEYEQINLVWHGGEPLLMSLQFYKEAYNICYNQNRKFTFAMQTNGTLLDEAFINFFYFNKTQIGLSFDGLTNKYTRGNTDIILEKIDLLKRVGFHPGVIMVASGLNVNSLLCEYENFKKLSLSFKINPLFADGAVSKNPDLLYDIKDYAKGLLALFEYWLYDTTCNINVSTCEEIVQLVLSHTSNICTHSSCLGRWICVTHEGNIYPCDRLTIPEFLLGNVFDLISLNDIYLSETFVNLLTNSICRRNRCIEKCSIYEMCYGGCNANAYLGDGISSANNVACEMHKLVLFKASRYIWEALNKDKEKLNPKFIELIQRFNVHGK